MPAFGEIPFWSLSTSKPSTFQRLACTRSAKRGGGSAKNPPSARICRGWFELVDYDSLDGVSTKLFVRATTLPHDLTVTLLRGLERVTAKSSVRKIPLRKV